MPAERTTVVGMRWASAASPSSVGVERDGVGVGAVDDEADLTIATVERDGSGGVVAVTHRPSPAP